MENIETTSVGSNPLMREAFFEKVQNFADNPPHKDPVVGSFYRALMIASETIPVYAYMIEDYLTGEPVELVSYRVNKIFKSHQTLFLTGSRRFHEAYPEGFQDARGWLEFMETNLSSPEHPDYKQLEKVLRLPDQKNRRGRARALAFGASVLSVRQPYEDKLVFHEPGSSNGHVLKALATREVGTAQILDDGDSKLGKRDEVRTALFNIATNRVAFGKGFGIEALPPRNPEDVDRIKAFSLMPRELDTAEEDTFDKLAAGVLPKVVNIKADYMDLDRRSRRILTKNPADITFLSHTLSQGDDVSKVIEAVLPFSKPRGLIVINEYATVVPEDRSIRVTDDWEEPWQCLTAVVDVRHPEDGIRPLIRWETSHCERGVFIDEELGGLSLNGIFSRPS